MKYRQVIESAHTLKIYSCIWLKINCIAQFSNLQGGNISRKKYILLYPLLFKFVTTPKKETALLAIPETCTDKIITLYHSSLFAGHQGVIKTYLTIGNTFFITGSIHYLQSNIQVCHIGQLSKNNKLSMRQLQTRIILNYKSLSRLSMDLKVIPRMYKGHRFILCIMDEVRNYLITVLIHQSRSEEMSDALIENVI